MPAYKVKAPWWLKIWYSKFIWQMPQDEPAVYLTFDDGPHPVATPFVLEQLKRFNAKATFFCIGKNVVAEEQLYHAILGDGHTVGNHTQNHVDGWKVSTEEYIKNVTKADEHIKSNLFRPPYGRIKNAQANILTEAGRIIYMWDVLSGDFDMNITPEDCLQNVLKYIKPGSIIVFHDSEKAWPGMSYALPRVLEYCQTKNWMLKALPKE